MYKFIRCSAGRRTASGQKDVRLQKPCIPYISRQNLQFRGVRLHSLWLAKARMICLPMTEWVALAVAVFLSAFWFTWSFYNHPLAKVPGPVWASISRTWLMYRMYRGDYQLSQLALHEK